MAHILNDEAVGDVTVALAILVSGFVHHYAQTPQDARNLISALRDLEDRTIAQTLGFTSLRLQ
jgi:hypothetical protein